MSRSPSWIFFFFQRHKVDFVLSVALETHLPLKEDQYTFMISVSSSVCGFRYVCVCVSTLRLGIHHIMPLRSVLRVLRAVKHRDAEEMTWHRPRTTRTRANTTRS